MILKKTYQIPFDTSSHLTLYVIHMHSHNTYVNNLINIFLYFYSMQLVLIQNLKSLKCAFFNIFQQSRQLILKMAAPPSYNDAVAYPNQG